MFLGGGQSDFTGQTYVGYKCRGLVVRYVTSTSFCRRTTVSGFYSDKPSRKSMKYIHKRSDENLEVKSSVFGRRNSRTKVRGNLILVFSYVPKELPYSRCGQRTERLKEQVQSAKSRYI